MSSLPNSDRPSDRHSEPGVSREAPPLRKDIFYLHYYSKYVYISKYYNINIFKAKYQLWYTIYLCKIFHNKLYINIGKDNNPAIWKNKTRYKADIYNIAL